MLGQQNGQQINRWRTSYSEVTVQALCRRNPNIKDKQQNRDNVLILVTIEDD